MLVLVKFYFLHLSVCSFLQIVQQTTRSNRERICTGRSSTGFNAVSLLGDTEALSSPVWGKIRFSVSSIVTDKKCQY